MTIAHDWMTRNEAADYLRVTTRTIDRYVAQRRIEASQLVPGGAVRISASSVERLLEGVKRA
jgi:excisionase family DNA binding protein